MTRSLLVLMALVALVAAAVMPIHRDRRALPDDGTGSVKIKCAPQTPCGWTVLKPNTKIVELNVSNTYCECSPELLCVQTEYDARMLSYVHRCRSEAEAKLIHFDDS